MTDGMFCAQYLSQYQEILSKMRLFGTRNCSKLGRSLYLTFSVRLTFLLYSSMNYRDFSVKSKLIISLFQTVKLSLSISLFQ